ncbi:MAG: hypothetical protein ABI557_04540 [Aureliella sp.]
MRLQLQSTIVLVQRLARLYPHYGQSELLRMGLLLSLHQPEVMAGELDFERVSDDELFSLSQDVSLQLSAAGDQHAAVADELDSLAATSACDFSPNHVFTLVRAIKIQSRVLDLYLGPVEVLS